MFNCSRVIVKPYKCFRYSLVVHITQPSFTKQLRDLGLVEPVSILLKH